ncbi:hypothetical protein CO675_26910 [Bradyrhizobium sp. C9]|nr:SANT/Myb-like DNA-binding domain-containing protein [Bradyrhizobium sp. C9]PDT74104.1 hypothetical protein CO675_26910 [Bradyrhizobium sp. C9]
MPAWSQEDEQRLLQLVRETGLSQREIAQKIGRSEASIQARLIYLRKRVTETGKTSACDQTARRRPPKMNAVSAGASLGEEMQNPDANGTWKLSEGSYLIDRRSR